ncbi:MAG TPA: ABC transporter substrate-binding protein [Actinomycetota bacterium]|nr:ABC transporter substrate-binding protein [Actinomycetota bacterium]
MEIRDERRDVTALFADLVGSTALGERLDPEELKLVVGDAVARMVRAIEAFGGTVKDLAGDGVLALFGAPAAHEDDAERAVRAGLRIVEDIATFGREVAEGWGIDTLNVRVGIDTGPVITGAIGAGDRVEFAALGDAVNVAARLQSHAHPGSVLVGEATQQVVADRFAWSADRAFELKGKSEPVTAFTVEGVADGSIVRTEQGSGPRMIGRDLELARLRTAVEGVAAGAGGVVFVTGEPGIGKTRMVHELRRAFGAETPEHGRSLWLEGRCVSYGGSIPYWPFRDLLRSWLGVGDDEPELRVRVALRRQVDRLTGLHPDEIVPYLSALLGLSPAPGEAERLEALSPEALQYRTFEVVRATLRRLAEDGPVAVALEDLHWADATSLQLLHELIADTETGALLVVCTLRPERDHGAWRLKEDVARTLPHRFHEVALEALSGDAGRELLAALVGRGTLPAEVERQILEPAEGNPFFLEELVRSMVDAGALVAEGDGWRFDHAVDLQVPPTVEKVILARIDRLPPASYEAVVSASVVGRSFSLPLLQAVAAGDDVRAALGDLMRVDLVREGRRWPDPEYRFTHALIQETAYRTLVADDRSRLHRRAATWLEQHHAGREAEVAGLLAHHWLGARDEDKAIRYLTVAGDRARQDYALDEAIAYYRELLPLLDGRGERQEIALVLFKLALALHMSLRFAEANETYQRAFEHWTPPAESQRAPDADLRVATSFLPDDPDPRSAIAWPNIQLCMQLFDRLVEQWPERTIVPSLAERWQIADDGLRYVFHLREGLTWSDGEPLTAHDVEFGIKRVLDPRAPGSSVAIYFVLEAGQEHYLGTEPDPSVIGVRALDDRSVEFRLAAPAPYFMSVMNRPDGGPQPRHAIEAMGDAWAEPGKQVVSGAFRVSERGADRLVLERRPAGGTARAGNVRRVVYTLSRITEALEPYERGELDMIAARYTPRLADLVERHVPDAKVGQAGWSGYLAFDHTSPIGADLEFRRALAHAIDRDTLASAMPANMVVATGGIVPPALQGHTPDISLRFDPEAALACLARSGRDGRVSVAALDDDLPILEPVLDAWRSVLGLTVERRLWSIDEIATMPAPKEQSPIYFTGWLPGYADPEYFLRLLFHSQSRTNEGGFDHPPFDELIERARQERSDRGRLALFHDADRMAVVDRVAVIPLVYGRSLAVLKPYVRGWWEFGKTSANFADLSVDPADP